MIENILSKKIADLTEDERKYATKQLEKFLQSDDWQNYESGIKKECEELHKKILETASDAGRSREFIYSYLDKEYFVANFMRSLNFGESEWAKIFVKYIIESAKGKEEMIITAIDPMIENLCFTAHDWDKLEYVTKSTVPQWLEMTINRYSKDPKQEEEKWAYQK